MDGGVLGTGSLHCIRPEGSHWQPPWSTRGLNYITPTSPLSATIGSVPPLTVQSRIARQYPSRQLAHATPPTRHRSCSTFLEGPHWRKRALCAHNVLQWQTGRTVGAPTHLCTPPAPYATLSLKIYPWSLFDGKHKYHSSSVHKAALAVTNSYKFAYENLAKKVMLE